MIVTIREEAAADIVEIYRYLEDRSQSGAANVLRAIYAGIAAIGKQPYASQRTDDPTVRSKVIHRYPYKVFYEIVDDQSVEILHVRHTSRQPWRGARA